MRLTEALKTKVEYSVGLSERGTKERPVLTTDFFKSNKKAECRRDLEIFEQKRGGYDSSDEESEEGMVEKCHGLVRADLTWSDQAPMLDRMAKSKRTRSYGKIDVIHSCLENLRLKACGIDEVDAETQNLENLSELNISGNKVQKISNLPPKLVSLHAYDNQIDRIDLHSCACARKLINLGLGYNKINHVNSWVQDLASIQILDLSFNNLTNLDTVLVALGDLEQLDRLFLAGNPFALLGGYRLHVISRLPQLKWLDGIEIPEEQDAPVVGGSILQDNMSIIFEAGIVTLTRDSASTTAVNLIVECVMPGTEGKTVRFPAQNINLDGETVQVQIDKSETLQLCPTLAVRDDIEHKGIEVRVLLSDVSAQEDQQPTLLSQGFLVVDGVLEPEANSILKIESEALPLSKPAVELKDDLVFGVSRNSQVVVSVYINTSPDSSPQACSKD